MKRFCLIIVSLTGMLFPLNGYSDGGTLTRKVLAPEDESAAWVISDPIVYREIGACSGIIDGKDTVEGFAFKINVGAVSVELFLTDSKPARLYCGEQKDERFYEFQSSEGVVETQERGDLNREDHLFRNVLLPTPPGVGSIPALVDIHCKKSKDLVGFFHKIRIIQCKTIYEGTLDAGQQQYAARLIFRSLDFSSSAICIVLDTNRDGVFHPLDDVWFSGNWFACLDGKIWNVRTTLEGEIARVSLEPYTGAVGLLQLQGEGIVQASVGALLPLVSPRMTVKTKPAVEFSIPYRENLPCALPVDDFVIASVWLQSRNQKEFVYQWPIFWTTEYTDFKITENQPCQVVVGGPLSDSIKAEMQNPFGALQINYEGCVNENRYRFAEMKYGDFLHYNLLQPTLWTLKDSCGAVVSAGPFENGSTNIQLPFFGFGTYQIQVVGSDNDLVRRTAVSIFYHSKEPFVLGIGLLIFIGAIVYFSFIDREYPFSKWLALLPGVVGFLWMYFAAKANQFDYGVLGACPLSVTCILVACRIFLPKGIIKVFGVSVVSLIVILYPAKVFSMNPDRDAFSFLLLGLLLSLLFTAFHRIVCGKRSQIRLFVAFLGVTFIPPIVFVTPLIMVEHDPESLQAFLSVFLPIFAFTFPLYGLTAGRHWARDLFDFRMNSPGEMEKYKEENKPESIA